MVGQKDCPICFNDWELNEEAKKMPCGHVFHEACLLPWLNTRNSCPICRYEVSGAANEGVERRSGEGEVEGEEGG
jgi:E3 ubiquitin-protein ligase RNF115/126